MMTNTTGQPTDPAHTGRRVRRTVLACAGVVAAMTGLAFASAPLYDLFCKATGYEGTPRVGAAPGPVSSEAARLAPLTIRFDTNVAPNLTWRFRPETAVLVAPLGETKTVFFKVENIGQQPMTGISTFNVQPGLMGSYFVKVECFCFEEHTLQPGESMEFPLVFYIEPKLRQDADIPDLTEMTLSYTYFASKKGNVVAQRSEAAPAPAPPQGRSNF